MRSTQETLSLMREVGFDFAYMFKYSERPDTKAARHMKDDVPETVKTRRLNEIIALQNQLSAKGKKADIGKTFEVLVEGKAKKPAGAMMGRTTGNKVVVFQAETMKPGEYVNVKITSATSATLLGEISRSVKKVIPFYALISYKQELIRTPYCRTARPQDRKTIQQL